MDNDRVHTPAAGSGGSGLAGLGERPAGRGAMDWRLGPAYGLAASLARAGDSPRVCLVGTALGDAGDTLLAMYAAFGRAGWRVSHLALFPEPNVADVQEHLLAQDLVWVAGGSAANLLALWRLHGIGPAMHAAWQAGVVLMGVSAGSVCWFAGGTTDAFGLPLRPVTDALGFLPYSNSPHHDAEEQRRPAIHQLRPRSGRMRLTRSRQRSSGHSAVAVLTLGPAGKAGPGLALFPGADGADRWPAGRPLRQAALASGYSRAAADEPAGHRSPGLRGCRPLTAGITAVPANIFGHMARRRVRRTGERGFAGATAAVVLGWPTVLIAAVTAELAA